MRDNKFLKFNLIVFIIFVVLFVVGGYMSNRISFAYYGSILSNPLSGKYYYLSGLILQIFSAFGVLIQLIFMNIKFISIHKIWNVCCVSSDSSTFSTGSNPVTPAILTAKVSHLSVCFFYDFSSHYFTFIEVAVKICDTDFNICKFFIDIKIDIYKRIIRFLSDAAGTVSIVDYKIR